MIFAHGSLGFFAALSTFPLWKKFGFSEFQKRWLLLIGFIAGIFPDVDLFYYYLVDAHASHRSLPTHWPITYVIICGILFAYCAWKKKRFAQAVVLVVLLGTWSHLLADGLFAQVQYLYPFSEEFFGMTDIAPAQAVANMLAINFIVEGTIIASFFYALIRMYLEDLRLRIPLVLALLAVYAGGVYGITYANAHIAHVSMPVYYDDSDEDGIVNIRDRDMDGDGLLNIDDPDADNDGEINPYELLKTADALDGVWYDPTNGGLIQIPARLGLLTNHDAPRILYDSAGVSLRAEMTADYAENAQDYVSVPSDNQFDRSTRNMRAWLMHQNRLELDLSSGRYQIGDLLFFESGYVAVVSGFDNSAQPYVLDVSSHRRIQERLLDEVVPLEGKVLERGKIIGSKPE